MENFWEPANDSELRFRLQLNGQIYEKPMQNLKKLKNNKQKITHKIYILDLI